ncbi:alpha/beta hydrolase [Aurantibacter crassamenti]|uniref:alpha/beta hydrolase n=1 Tax=Aurantibacter crassamenti TaxID=1837375 RepID=UPI001939C483|nr:alpha/beta hydrolase [Aurantibacter crassamenti]MBM1107225.1 alpha/beta hydrolase [Aurantibacter crassamenti]
MKLLKRLFKTFLILIILIVGILYFFQEKLIFNSSTLPQNYEYQFTTNFEELFLKAKDGAILNGVHFKQENPKGVIIYCHGNTGEVDEWGKWGEELSNRYGYDVIVWDYRGFGKSTGKRRQKRMLDDGYLFYEYCKQFFNSDEIVVYGRSLGGFFATHIVKNSNAGRLVLESTPMSLLKIAQQEYPFLPSKYLLKYRFQSNQNIKRITVPTYIIHGTTDELIPYENGVGLFELSTAKIKQLFTIENGKHNDLGDFEKEYSTALDEIFK